MQTILNNAMVAHVWAQQTQEHGRSNNGQFYFEGNIIYSYGKHFPIAMIDEKGNVLFTKQEYSVTTRKHIGLVHQALSKEQREKIINIPDFGSYGHCMDMKKSGKFDGQSMPHKRNWQAFKDEYQDYLKKHIRARSEGKKTHMLHCANKTIYDMKAYKRYFGLKYSIPKMPDMSQFAEKLKAQAKKKALETKKLKAKQLKEAQEKIQAWKDGEKVSIPWNIDKIFMRIEGENIVTSKSASFPIEHGKKALPFILACIEKRKTWSKNGQQIRLGHFAIDTIDTKGNVKAGCHYVEYDEIKRVSEILGLV